MENNSQNYLSLIYGNNIPKQMLTDKEIADIQAKLWTLLGKRTENFTMGDSSSIPVETAQELLKSICFSVGIYLKSINADIHILNNENLELLLKSSWSKIEMKIRVGKELLNKLNKNTLPIENTSFSDTVNGISTFFKKYDYRFFAHEIPGDIDYQLCHAVPEELQGIEYINEYLHRLLIENKLIRKFNADNIKLLLESYCADYKGLLINIYEPVVTNAVGLKLLNGNIYSLNISNSDRNKLIDLFIKWSKEEALEILNHASDKLCNDLQINSDTEKEYLKATVINLYPRIESVLPTKQLNNIFLSFHKTKRDDSTDIQFIEGSIMDDHKLQILIDEINSCRYLSDKIAIFKQEIHSLGDCIEVLNVCFWDDECIELFNVLDKEVLDILLDFLGQKYVELPDWHSESGWEQQLIKYVKS